MRIFGPNISRLQRARDIPGLVSALDDSDPQVQCAAARALGEIGEKSVVGPLCRAALDGPLDEKRTAALEALSSIRNPAAQESLFRALGVHRDARLRRPLATALGAVADLKTAVAMQPLLADPDAHVRSAAAAAITRTGLPADPVTRAWLAAAQGDWERVASLEHSGLPALRFHVSHGGENCPPGALRALGRSRDPADTALLCPHLRSRSPRTRWAAAVALGRCPNGRGLAAVQALRAALQDKDERVSGASADALVTIGNPLALLQDANALVRRASAALLGRRGESEAVPQLCAGLRDSAGEVRTACADALAAIGDPSTLRSLLEFSGGGVLADPSLAVSVLRRMGRAREAAALDAMATGDWASVVACGAAAVPALCVTLADGDEDVRRAAAEALVKVGAPDTGDLLWDILKRRGRIDYTLAASVLGRMGRDVEAAVWTALATGEWNAVVSRGAVAVPDICKALRARVPEALDPACMALVQIAGMTDISSSPALEVLCQALADGDRRVRWQAATALELIGLPDQPAVQASVAVVLRQWPRAAALGAAGVSAFLLHVARGWVESIPRAAHSLGRCLGPDASEALRSRLRGSDSHEAVRMASAIALASMGDQEGLDVLLAAWWEYPLKGRQDYLAVFDLLSGGEASVALSACIEADYGRLMQLGRVAVNVAVPELCSYLKEGCSHARDGTFFWRQGFDRRRGAAQALVRLHHSGALSEQSQLRVLEYRGQITAPHRDGWTEEERHQDNLHSDRPSGWSSDCASHTDSGEDRPSRHDDHGIGVEF